MTPRSLDHREDEDEDEDSGDDLGEDKQEYRARNCNDCNRQFCLDYNLPICRGAVEKDVFTICFRKTPRSGDIKSFEQKTWWRWTRLCRISANIPLCSRTRFSERPGRCFYIYRRYGRTLGMGITQTLGGEVDRGLAALALVSATIHALWKLSCTTL